MAGSFAWTAGCVAATQTAHTIEHVRVDYDHDHEAVVHSLEALQHPGQAYLIAHQRGDVKSRFES